MITITFLATFMGGELVQFVGFGYRSGLSFVLQAFPWLFVPFLIGWFVLPKLAHFKDCYTLGDVVRQLYGKHAAYFVSAWSASYCFFFMLSQMAFMGHFCGLVGMKREHMILLIGFATLFYTISGGVRTVTSTDVLQFILVVIGITIFTQTLFAKVGGVQNMISEWEAKEIGKLHFWKSKGIISMLLSMLLYGVFPVRIFMPPFFQRYQMVQDKHRIYHLFGIFYFLVRLLLGLAGISLFKLKGVRSYSGLEAPVLFAAVISSDLFSSTTQTLIFLMVIALGISTVDSYMNAVSIVIARDLIKPLSSKINELKLVRQVGFGLGVLCMLLAPYVPDPGLLFTASVASLGFLF